MPGDITPQLATLVDKPPDGAEWLHEIKYDGYRLLARIDKGKARLITRNGISNALSLEVVDRGPVLGQRERQLDACRRLVAVEDAGELAQDKLRTLLLNHSLLNRDNVVITPHIAFNSREAVQRILDTTVENVRAFLSGKPQNLVKS